MPYSQDPLVTVIIPSYNHEKYILQAINSVKDQTYQNWELIIIDDGSTDGTHKVLNSLEADPRITLILHSKNKCLSVRLNEAIALSSGDFISTLASDDWYLPEKIEKQISMFVEKDSTYGVIYSGGYRYYEKTEEMKLAKTNLCMKRGNILVDLLLGDFFVYPTTPMIKKDCFIQFPFDETYKAEGEAIHFKIAMCWKYDFVDEPLVIMREHTYNIGGNTKVMLEENIRHRKELFEHPLFPKKLKKYKKDVLYKIYRMKGLEFLRIHKSYMNGFSCLFQAIRLKPFNLDWKIYIGFTFCSFGALYEACISSFKRRE